MPHSSFLQGSVLTGADLATLTEGLLENHLLHYDYLLTGYIGECCVFIVDVSAVDWDCIGQMPCKELV